MSSDTTQTEPAAPKARVPLYLTLVGVFVTIFIAFGVVLILFFHSESKRIELVGANDLMDRIGRHMQTSIAELFQPAQGLVDIASKSAPFAGSTLDERLASLGALTEALRLNPEMSSIFVGYEDGDFFLVRLVGDRRVAAETQRRQCRLYARRTIGDDELHRVGAHRHLPMAASGNREIFLVELPRPSPRQQHRMEN